MAASKKAAKLLQQSDGPLRFGKHSLICCSVYQNDLRNARRKSQQRNWIGGINMKQSQCTSYKDLPLFLST